MNFGEGGAVWDVMRGSARHWQGLSIGVADRQCATGNGMHGVAPALRSPGPVLPSRLAGVLLTAVSWVSEPFAVGEGGRLLSDCERCCTGAQTPTENPLVGHV